MKIFTAKEARALHGKCVNQDRISDAIRVVNTAIKGRVSTGSKSVLIGKNADEWSAVSILNEAERSELLDGLRAAGYTVDETLSKPLFRLFWDSETEE